jgi:uncharacterized protein
MTNSCTSGYFNAMKFTLDARSGVNLIRAYSARELRIGETLVTGSCIVTADTLISDWHPAAAAQMTPGDLEALFALDPQIVLWGASDSAHAPSMSVRAAMAARSVALEAMDLGAACRTFNILVQEERRVAAALFL